MGKRTWIFGAVLAALCPLSLLAADGVRPETFPVIDFGDGPMLEHRLEGPLQVDGSDNGIAALEGAEVEVTVSPQGDVVAAQASREAVLMGVDAGPAIAAARTWRFRPFLYDGAPVTARGTIRIRYAPRGEWRDANAPLPPIDYDHLQIRLVRTACFGACPDYSVTIDGAGHIEFATRPAPADELAALFRSHSMLSGVLVEGTHHATMTRAALDALIGRFQAAHFYGLRAEYTGGVTDNPTYILSFRSGAQSWTVRDYVGQMANMPALVTALEDDVDSAAGTARWVKGRPDTVPGLRAEGFDAASQAGLRLALRAIGSPDADEQVVLDLIAAGLPLEGSVRLGDSTAQPLGRLLLESAVQTHRPRLFALLSEHGWLARLARPALSDLFAGSGGGCDAGIARALIGAGALPTAHVGVGGPGEDAAGRTALIVAAQPYGPCQRVERGPLLAALIALGADPNATDAQGRGILFGLEDPALQEQLLAAGARADLKDKDGRSAAFSSWNDRIVLGLLDAGADPHGRDSDGHSLRETAREHDMPAVLAWLDAHHVP